MRPLKSHFPAHALPTLEAVLKQTQEARGFRRAQAVREVVAGHHVNAVSETFHLANAALRQWVQRFAQQGPQGLLDRPRPGLTTQSALRPRKASQPPCRSRSP
jgi:transposase